MRTESLATDCRLQRSSPWWQGCNVLAWTRFPGRGCGLLLGAMVAAQPATAQLTSQEFHLQQGWNAIYLELDPEPGDADAVFAGMPIKAVWVRGDALRAETTRGCEAGSEDPACVAGSGTGWRVWFPPDRPEHVINSLRVLRGGRAYLIRAKEVTRLTVVGRPNPSKTRWTAGYNLTGFHVVDDPQRTPTIAEYLAGSPAHAGTKVYRVDATGTLTPVPDPTTEQIRPGAAYWVSSTTTTTYDGPLDIDAATLRGIAFTPRLSEHSIRVQNRIDRASTVHLRQVGARELPLTWFDTVGTDESSAMSWRDLSDNVWNLSESGKRASTRTLRIAARRGVSGWTEDHSSSQQVGVIELSNDSGFRRLIPLEMERGGSYGLWVGTVTVDAVSWVTDPNESLDAVPTSSQFVFRMIIHNSASGAVLLPDVLMGIDSADPENPLPILIGPACPNREEYLDSETNAPRVSTTAFSIDGSQSMSGVFATSLTVTLELPEDQRLSPFRHQFNPTHECNFVCVESTDHDGEPCTDNSECGDGRCEAVGGGCRKVIRLLDLSFDDQDSQDPRWGATLLSGTYTETIGDRLDEDTCEGCIVYNKPITVAGRFRLLRVSEISNLCDQ